MTYIQLLISGVMHGGLLALMSIGLTLTLGVMRIVDLSYGAYYTIGAYLSMYLLVNVGIGFFTAGAVTMLAVFIFGLLCERFLVKKVRVDMVSTIILTFAFAYVIEESVTFIWGTPYYSVTPFVSGTFNFSDIFIEKQRVFSFLVAMILITLVLLALKYLKIGKAMRMVAQETDGAYLVGINVSRVYQITFAVAAVMAASAAYLLSPIYLIYPSMGWPTLLKAFGIVKLGGMGSVKGAVIAAFILGLVEVFTSYFIAETLSYVFYFITIFLVIVIKPSGLFGIRERV